jgi:hypothetical protein
MPPVAAEQSSSLLIAMEMCMSHSVCQYLFESEHRRSPQAQNNSTHFVRRIDGDSTSRETVFLEMVFAAT